MASTVTSFTYDGVNNLLTEVDALGKTTTYAYDERNRLETKTLPDPDSGGSGNPAPQFTYVYDGVGNVTDEGNPYFADNVTHTYDAYGRLTNTSQGAKDDSYVYDVLGRRTEYTNSLHNPGVLDQKETWEYDSLGRMTKHSTHDPDNSGPTARPFETFTYNAAGQPATHTDMLGYVTSYDYTTAGWLNSVTLPDPDASGPLYSPSGVRRLLVPSLVSRGRFPPVRANGNDSRVKSRFRGL